MAQIGQFNAMDIDPEPAWRGASPGGGTAPPDNAFSGADLTSWLPRPVQAAANVVSRARDAFSLNTDVGGAPVGGDFESALGAPHSKTELALQAAALLPVGKVLKPIAKALAPAAEGLLSTKAIAPAAEAAQAEAAPAAEGLLWTPSAGRVTGKILRYDRPTVIRPLRNEYPGIYSNPKDLVAEAAARARAVPESPLLKQVFGVTRDDLWNISQQGTREGNLFTTDSDRPFRTAKNPKGAAVAEQITSPRNTQRMQDIIAEARKYPELYRPMASWYTMDPVFWHFQRLYGNGQEAVDAYRRFNAMVSMASPGSDVLTEINRGTAAHWLATQGRFADFRDLAGIAEGERGADFPDDMRAILGHPYHLTAQGLPMERYLTGGMLPGNLFNMTSAKVPSYIWASGAPETGFQTRWPVGDAHWSRFVGLSDVRTGGDIGASASVPEMVSLAPWWRNRVAGPMGLEAVPAQGVVWGAGSGATGVTSPIGAGKMELLAIRIGEAAKRLGVSVEQARDMVLRGGAHAAIAGGLLGGAALSGYLQSSHPLDSPEDEYQAPQPDSQPAQETPPDA